MMTWNRGSVLPRRLWSPPRRLQSRRGQAQAVLAPPPSLIGSPGTRVGGGRRRGHSGLGRRPPSGEDERPADSGLGPHGHGAAGPVATAEGGGASGSGGRGEPPRGLGVWNGTAEPSGHAPLGLASPRGPSRDEARPGSRPRPPRGWVGPGTGGGAATLSRSVSLRPRLRGDVGAGSCLCRAARRTGPSVPDPCAASGCARCCSRVMPPTCWRRAGRGRAAGLADTPGWSALRGEMRVR